MLKVVVGFGAFDRVDSFSLVDGDGSARLIVFNTELIVFIIGGICYEETKVCEQFNALKTGVTVVLGGSTVLNARAFVDDLRKLQEAGG